MQRAEGGDRTGRGNAKGNRHAERRRSFRVHVEGQASLWHRGLLMGHYHLHDLSIGGCLLTDGPVQKGGEDVDVLLRLPHLEPLALAGRVTRTGRGFTGVRFYQPSARAEDMISELVFDALAHERGPEDVVLVVEPRVERQQALVRALRELGVRTVTARTALDAVQLLVEEGPHVRAVFIDASAPPLRSRELVEFLAHNHPGVRRVLIGDQDELKSAWLEVTTGELDAVLEAPFRVPPLRHLLVRLGCPPHDAQVQLS